MFLSQTEVKDFIREGLRLVSEMESSLAVEPSYELYETLSQLKQQLEVTKREYPYWYHQVTKETINEETTTSNT